jgi:hypothetical protein
VCTVGFVSYLEFNKNEETHSWRIEKEEILWRRVHESWEIETRRKNLG